MGKQGGNKATFTRDRVYSVPFGLGSTMVRIHCLHETGSKLERYGSISDLLHKWAHLVTDN